MRAVTEDAKRHRERRMGNERDSAPLRQRTSWSEEMAKGKSESRSWSKLDRFFSPFHEEFVEAHHKLRADVKTPHFQPSKGNSFSSLKRNTTEMWFRDNGITRALPEPITHNYKATDNENGVKG